MNESKWHEMSEADRDDIAARCRSIANLRAAVTPRRGQRNLMPAILRSAVKAGRAA
jgi:hypothetical protein